ncbi:hypothetical protein Tco_1405774 [Tanacetum coccineum]
MGKVCPDKNQRFFAWENQDRCCYLPVNISRRGIDHSGYVIVSICDNAIVGVDEAIDHLFFRCGLVRDIANKVLSWWNLDHAILNSYAEWKSWLVSIRMDSKLKKMFEGVWYSIWCSLLVFVSNKIAVPKKKKKEVKDAPKEWTVEQEIALCQCWCDVSENNISGNSMKAKGFWEAVIRYFKKPMESGTQKNIEFLHMETIAGRSITTPIDALNNEDRVAICRLSEPVNFSYARNVAY